MSERSRFVNIVGLLLISAGIAGCGSSGTTSAVQTAAMPGQSLGCPAGTHMLNDSCCNASGVQISFTSACPAPFQPGTQPVTPAATTAQVAQQSLQNAASMVGTAAGLKLGSTTGNQSAATAGGLADATKGSFASGSTGATSPLADGSGGSTASNAGMQSSGSGAGSSGMSGAGSGMPSGAFTTSISGTTGGAADGTSATGITGPTPAENLPGAMGAGALSVYSGGGGGAPTTGAGSKAFDFASALKGGDTGGGTVSIMNFGGAAAAGAAKGATGATGALGAIGPGATGMTGDMATRKLAGEISDEEYFARTSEQDNLFKIVERGYQRQQMAWAQFAASQVYQAVEKKAVKAKR